jgi:hypothetical protein
MQPRPVVTAAPLQEGKTVGALILIWMYTPPYFLYDMVLRSTRAFISSERNASLHLSALLIRAIPTKERFQGNIPTKGFFK